MNTKSKKEIFIVLPAFGEGKVIGEVISNIFAEGYKNIIVVDDGSKDDTNNQAKLAGAIVIRHLINRGKGAATQTGLDAAKKLGADFVVTMDSDGQHDPKDIEVLVSALELNEIDVALGSRLTRYSEDMPIARKSANVVGNIVTFLFYGIYVSDSQSGFRAYNRKALELIKTQFDRYEFESEVLHQIYLKKLILICLIV